MNTNQTTEAEEEFQEDALNNKITPWTEDGDGSEEEEGEQVEGEAKDDEWTLWIRISISHSVSKKESLVSSTDMVVRT